MNSYLEIGDELQVIDRYGFHIRDIGLLASALARPATTVTGTEAYPQLALKAAALLESVARFHPLIDGNKRTAWTPYSPCFRDFPVFSRVGMRFGSHLGQSVSAGQGLIWPRTVRKISL